MDALKVMKFGGTSVATAERLRSVADLAAAALAGERVALVVSAAAGVTDRLVASLAAAVARREEDVVRETAAIAATQAAIVDGLADELGAERTATLSAELAAIARATSELLRGVALLGDASPRVEARIVTAGERATVAALAALLAARGLAPETLDPVAFLLCSGDPLDATPHLEAIRDRLAGVRGEGGARLLLVPGFFGGDAKGELVCLGRGGSDYTAALVAQALDARRLEIWTDVDGIYSADPRLAPAARRVDRLSFEEALELAHFGAKVLHPKTIAPARAAGIPVAIRDSFAPEAPGTLVDARREVEGAERGRVACGISFLRDVALVTLAGARMGGVPGVAARLFAALAAHRISVLLITQGSSETTISLAVAAPRAGEAAEAVRSAFESEIATGRVDAVTVRPRLAIVSLVGDGMRERVGVAARFFGALGDAAVNVAAIAQGASERSISAVVEEAEGARAVRAIHERFFEGDPGGAEGVADGAGVGSPRGRSRALRAGASVATITAFAPAGVGNLLAGFDVLGAAVRPLDGTLWGDRLRVSPSTSGRDELVVAGPFADRLPPDPAANLVFRARDAFAKRLGEPLPPLAFALTKELPVASGLASSASSVAATLRALDEAFGRPLSPRELLDAAGEAEGAASGSVHLDNVAPALFGGVRLCDPEGRAHRLPFPHDLVFVLLVPELALETRAARAALPRERPASDGVAFAQNLATLVHALHAGERGLLRATLRDLWAEPFRAPLVAGFREVQAAALASGAFGATLSGAGPSIVAIAGPGDAETIAAAGVAAWRSAGVAASYRLCELDGEGARRIG